MSKIKFPIHLASLFILLILMTPISIQARPMAVPALPVQASGKGEPWINFKDSKVVSTAYSGPDELVRVLESSSAQPLTLASADFDGDGIPDLVSGYTSGESGFITIHRGNVDAIYPYSEGAMARKEAGTFSDAPFFPNASLFSIPVSPDFIGAGDFNGDDQADIVIADRKQSVLYLIPGDGRGGINTPERVDIPGTVTALTVGEINRRDGLPDVIVGVQGEGAYHILVFEGPQGALRSLPEALSAPGEITSLSLGQLDEYYAIDLAAASGGELLVIHGRDRKLTEDAESRAGVGLPDVERHGFDFSVAAVAVGDFAEEESYRNELALLSAEGAVHLFDRSMNQLQAYSTVQLPAPVSSHLSLIRLRVSSAPTDDLLVMDSSNHQLHILMTGDEQVERTPLGPRVAATLDVSGAPVALLPMRLNMDALNDLVILQDGENSLIVASTNYAHTFTVTNPTDDYADNDTSDDICATDIGGCTIRAAIQQANASAGTDLINFSWSGLVNFIRPTSDLPDLTGPVTVDGGDKEIVISGENISGAATGLMVASDSTITRMTFNQFDADGIYDGFGLSLNGANNHVEDCTLGLSSTPDGDTSSGNENGGIVIGGSASLNTVGGTTSAARNLISGNRGNGVQIGEPGNAANNNTVMGNYIGVSISGVYDAGNDEVGVIVGGGTSSNNTIKDNTISGNQAHGIVVQDGGSGNLVQGNKVGTNVGGTAALPNGTDNQNGTYSFGDGVQFFAASNNTVGGTTEALRNIISGNYLNGVEISFATVHSTNESRGFSLGVSRSEGIGDNGGSEEHPLEFNTSTGNQVQGNYIGLNSDGTDKIPNLGAGVMVYNVSTNTVGGTTEGTRNTISGNGGDGVVIFGNDQETKDNKVQGNYIGLKPTGTEILGNNGSGVMIHNAITNTIGGPTAGERNVISANGFNGVLIWASDNKPANGNKVQGNYLGTDNTGKIIDPNGTPGSGDEFGNYMSGVTIDSASGNTIGGQETGARNVIGGNLFGVIIFGENAKQNIIENNAIGVDTTEEPDTTIGNTLAGIFISEGSENVIGGVEAAASNDIMFNGAQGVAIITGTQNSIVRNRIFYNGGLPIDLDADGVTENDINDADTGANDLQNYPVISGYSTTAFTGTLKSKPNIQYSLDFYKYTICDPNNTLPPGFGLAKDYFFSGNVTTDAEGLFGFIVTLGGEDALAAGEAVAAIARDPDGNTSEISTRPFQLHASSPYFVPQGVLEGHHKILLYTTAHQAIAEDLKACINDFDLFIVIDGDTDNPLEFTNDGQGLNNRTEPDFNANDWHHSRWFTTTATADITLELYMTRKTRPVTEGFVTDRLTIKHAVEPPLAVFTDFRELFKEFNLTSTDSAKKDVNKDKTLDYYEAVERIYKYAEAHEGVVIDVRQNAYTVDRNYFANTATRQSMGEDIDDMVELLGEEFELDLLNIAIIGDDAVVPFYRYPTPEVGNVAIFNERRYPGQVDGIWGLVTEADGNPTMTDTMFNSAASPRGYIMSDVPYGTIEDELPNYPEPDFGVGRVFYDKPADLIAGIDAYEESISVVPASTKAGIIYLPNEATGIQFVDVVNRSIRPVLRSHYGAGNLVENVHWNGPAAFQDERVYLFNGASSAWRRNTCINASENVDLMMIYTHANSFKWLTAARRLNTAYKSYWALNVGSATMDVAVSAGCHSGYAPAWTQDTNHRYYIKSIPRAMLYRHVAYIAPTPYGIFNSHNPRFTERIMKDFVEGLYDDLINTTGEAYREAIGDYQFGDTPAVVVGYARWTLYGTALYGLPTQPIAHEAPASKLAVSHIASAPVNMGVKAGELVQFTSTETVSVTHFSFTMDEEGKTIIDVPMLGGRTGEPFGPVIPSITRVYPLPFGATGITVTVENTESHLSSPIDLKHGEIYFTSLGLVTGTFTYTNPYPGSVLYSRVFTDTHGPNLALTIVPMQYNPDTKQATLFDQIDYQISYQTQSATSVQNLSINHGKTITEGNISVPISLTVSTTSPISGTLEWAVEDGTGSLVDSGGMVYNLSTGISSLTWNVDASGWATGRHYIWVALQNSWGRTIASGWAQLLVSGETVTLKAGDGIFTEADQNAEVRAIVRNETGAGVPGRSGDLQLWVSGNLASEPWFEDKDGIYTTTVSLTGLEGGVSISVTLTASLPLSQGGIIKEYSQFIVDHDVPTSTLWLTPTETASTAWVYADWGDEVSGISVITLEYNIDGGEWQFWTMLRPGYIASEESLFGPYEPVAVDLYQHQYCFRSQAMDAAGHVEPTHSEPDACTSELGFRIFLPLVQKNYTPPPPPPPDTRFVMRYGSDDTDCTNPDNPCGTIQYAVDQAQERDEIRIAGYSDAYTGGDSEGSSRWTYWQALLRDMPPSYDGPASTIALVHIDKSVILRGGYSTDFQDWDPDIYKTVFMPGLSGYGSRVVYVAPNASPTLEYIHIIEGDATNQGGIYNLFVDYESGGAGIFADGEFTTTVPITISNCTVAYNRSSTNYNAGAGGIVIQQRDNAVLKDNIIHHNVASASGGQSYGWGGGILVTSSADVLISGNTIYSNTAVTGYGRGNGAGLRLSSADGTVVTNNHFYGNFANESGGGIHARFTDDITINNNVFEGNIAGTNCYATGGGIDLWYVDGLTISENQFYNNIASISIEDHGLGGGIYLSSVTDVVVSTNVISGNIGNDTFLGSAGGIGLFQTESVVIRENVIQNNIATLNPAPDINSVGGGVRISLNSYDIQVINNIIVGNAATGGGSGVMIIGYVDDNTNASLIHNTIADNVLPTGYHVREGNAALRQSIPPQLDADPDSSGYAELAFIVEQNASNPVRSQDVMPDQGILIPFGVVLNGVNNIISGHTVGISFTNSTSSTVSLDHTLWNNTTDYLDSFTHTNDRTGDPLFTPDYHLSAGSAAIDQGTNAGVTTDIDGESRPHGGGYDIGADELVEILMLLRRVMIYLR